MTGTGTRGTGTRLRHAGAGLRSVPAHLLTITVPEGVTLREDEHFVYVERGGKVWVFSAALPADVLQRCLDATG